MSLPTVIVEVEDNEVADTHVIGPNVHVVVIDWDHIEEDPEEAKGLLEEMSDLPGTNVTEAVFARLKGIIEDSEEDDDDIEEEDEIEDDDEDDEDDIEERCHECGGFDCEGECMDDDGDD